MKKCVLLYLLLFIGIASLQAQADTNSRSSSGNTYKPFIMDGTCEWFTVEWYDNYYKHTISAEDTTIQGKTYKKVFYQECKQTDREYVGAIREEDKCIYYLAAKNESKTEMLLYDFNMKVGDCISYYSGEVNLKLARIDNVQIEGETRRRYYFYDMDHDPDEIYPFDSWIEGVGSEQELMRPFAPLATCQGCHLRVQCVHQGDKVIYLENVDSPCSCEKGQSVQDDNADKEYQILKNSIENNLLSIELKDAKFDMMQIYSWDGKMLMTKDISVNNGTLNVPLVKLQAGNYILILSREDGSMESARIIVL